MKAVMASVRPKYCELIASGRKTLEVRKTRPKLETPFKCYIYCTVNGCTKKERDRNVFTDVRGTVIGEFVCDGILPLSIYYSDPNSEIALKEFPETSLTDKQIIDYLGNGKEAFGWHISALKIYEKPMELSEFSRFGFYGMGNSKVVCGNYACKHFVKSYNYDEPPECGIDTCQLTRPPQSWCYVEVLERGDAGYDE
jgi:predicted transcriptional regulator